MKTQKLKSNLPSFVIYLFEKLRFLGFFFKSYKIANQHEPVLIIGSGRSGNTLLRSMLMEGGEIVFPPESYVWPRLYRKSLSLSSMDWNDYVKVVLGEFQAFKEFYTWKFDLSSLYAKAAELPQKERNLGGIIHLMYTEYAKNYSGKENIRWGDKTPINTIFIDKIIKIFPKAKIIHIVRDPRDVASSYVKANLYTNEIDAVKFWDLAVTKANALKSKLPANQFHEVRYENLVSNPGETLKNVCDFIKVSYSDKMLNFWENFDKLGDTNSHEHHKNLSNPLSVNSIGKWKQYLSEGEAKSILDSISSTNNKYVNV